MGLQKGSPQKTMSPAHLGPSTPSMDPERDSPPGLKKSSRGYSDTGRVSRLPIGDFWAQVPPLPGGAANASITPSR